MKRRIIALMLAGILSISSLGGLGVYAMEGGETESQTDSNVETDTEDGIPVENETKERVSAETVEETEETANTEESVRETNENDTKTIETLETEMANESIGAEGEKGTLHFAETMDEVGINGDSLHINKCEATVGDQIHIGVKVTGDWNIVDSAYIIYRMPITGKKKYIGLKYNENIGEFETDLEITDSFESGTWIVHSIILGVGEFKNVFLYNSLVEPSMNDKADLSAGNFVVSGTRVDVTTPEIDTDSLKVDKQEVGTGDKVQISLKVTDDESGVDAVDICYFTPTKQQEWIDLQYNNLTDNYEAIVNITDETEVGTWKIDCIYAVSYTHLTLPTIA